MKIRTNPEDFIINVTQSFGSSVESDFLMRMLFIKNDEPDTIILKKIQFDLKIKDKTRKQIIFPEETISSLAAKFAKRFSKFSDQNAQILLGKRKFWNADSLSGTNVLAPDEETGILFEHFRLTEEAPVDECAITVAYSLQGKDQVMTLTMPVIDYKNKNEYIFPLKGTWVIYNSYQNIHFHRRVYFEEFAMDLVQFSKDLVLVPKSGANEDYAHYGKEVYAVAEGEVVSCFSEFPENPPGFGSRLPQEQWDSLIKEYGMKVGMAGNYVIIRHQGDEYSLYGHLIPHSLTVKEGDTVNQGQVIGLLGNSGNSDAPHLHFQLMDGEDVFSARGLPCTFTNVKDATGEPVSVISADTPVIIVE